jgi:hypothetical protein
MVLNPGTFVGKILRKFGLGPLLFLGACIGGGGGSQDAALVVNPGDAIRIERGPDMMGLSAKINSVRVFESTLASTAVAGRLAQEAEAFTFKYARGNEYSELNVAIATLESTGATETTLSAFMISNPVRIDISTTRTVDFFKKIIKRNPESREEILRVLEAFRTASASSCLKETAGLSARAANRAWSNAFSASGNVDALVDEFELDFDQKTALAPQNFSPYILSGFPFPNPTLALTPTSALEETPSRIDVTIFDPDGDVFSSQWSKLDGSPVSGHTEIAPVASRANLLDAPEILRPMTGLAFKGGYNVSTPANPRNFPVRLTLCDGGRAVNYDYDIVILNRNRPPVLVTEVPSTPIDLVVGEEKKITLVFEDPDEDEIDIFASLTTPENVILHRDDSSFEINNRLKGTFEFNEDLRDRSNAGSFPERGNPWLEGLTARGFESGEANPQLIEFFEDSPGVTKARITLKKPNGSLDTQAVPVSYDYYKDPSSPLAQHMTIRFGDATTGLNVYRPYPLENTNVFCHVQRTGFGMLFKMRLYCGYGRLPENFTQDGEWMAEFKCPTTSVESDNPSCLPIRAVAVPGGAANARQIQFTARVNRALFQKQTSFLYVLNAVDAPGLGTLVTMNFRISDRADVAPLQPPLAIKNAKFLDHFGTFTNTGMFSAPEAFLPSTDPLPANKKKFEPFQRSAMISDYSPLNPFQRGVEVSGGSRNLAFEPPGSLRKIRYRGPASYDRENWWQHFRWTLESPAGSHTSFPALNGVKHIRFLASAPLQKYPKLVIAKPNCTTLDCSLQPTVFTPTVPNAKDSLVLEYEILSSSENSFEFRVPRGLDPEEDKASYCEARFHFTRASHLPTPAFAYESDNDKINAILKNVSPAHTNFQIRCADSLANARASNAYAVFGPGLDAFVSEPEHPEYLSGGGTGKPVVSPSLMPRWNFRQCQYVEPSNVPTTKKLALCTASTKLDTSSIRFLLNALNRSPAGIALDFGATLPPEASGFFDVSTFKIDPLGQRLILPTSFKGSTLTHYRWCRYGFRDQMSTLVLTCSRTDPGATYPDLYGYTLPIVPAAVPTQNTKDYPKLVTIHLAYSPAVTQNAVPLAQKTLPDQFYLGSAQERFNLDLSDASNTPADGTNLAGVATKIQRLAGANALMTSKNAHVGFKVELDSSYWQVPSFEKRALRPAIVASRCYKKDINGDWALDTAVVPHAWAPNLTTGALELQAPSSSPKLKPSTVGVSRLRANEFLMSWRAGADGDYRLEYDLEQPQVSLSLTPAPAKKLTLSVDVKVEAFTFPPYFDVWPASHYGSYEGQSVYSYTTLPATSYYLTPMEYDPAPGDTEPRKIYVTANTDIYELSVPQKNYADRAAKFTLYANGEKQSAALVKPGLSAFWLTKTDPVTGRTILANPTNESDWLSLVPLDKTTGLLRVPAEAFIQMPQQGEYIDPKCEVDNPTDLPSCRKAFTGASVANMKVSPEAPLNALIQEDDIASYLASASDKFRLFSVKDKKGFAYADNSLFQLYVKKSATGEPAHQKQLMLRIDEDTTDAIAGTDYSVSDPIIPTDDTKDTFPAEFEILNAEYDGLTEKFKTSTTGKVRCRIYIDYEDAHVAFNALDKSQGPQSILQWVCRSNAATTFPTELSPGFDLSTLGQADANEGYDYTNLVGIKTVARNPGSFTVSTSAGAFWFENQTFYSGYFSQINWGQSTLGEILKPDESLGQMQGIIAFFDGKNMVLSALSMTAVHVPEKATITAGSCPATTQRPLSRSTEPSPMNCTLPRYNYSFNGFDKASPTLAYRFVTGSTAANVGKHVFGIDTTTATLDNTASPTAQDLTSYLNATQTKQRFDINSTSATGWKDYSKHRANKAAVPSFTTLWSEITLADGTTPGPIPAHVFKVTQTKDMSYAPGTMIQIYRWAGGLSLLPREGALVSMARDLANVVYAGGAGPNDYPSEFSLNATIYDAGTSRLVENVPPVDPLNPLTPPLPDTQCRLYESASSPLLNLGQVTLDMVCLRDAALGFPAELAAGFDYAKIGTLYSYDPDPLVANDEYDIDFTNLVAMRTQAVIKDEAYLPKVQWSGSSYNFEWSLPKFPNGTSNATASAYYVPGIDYNRTLFDPSIDARINFDKKQSNGRKINRSQFVFNNYSFPYRIRGERSVEWPVEIPADVSKWTQNMAFQFDEENLPPCLAVSSSAACLVNSGTQLQDGVAPSVPSGEVVVSNPGSASGSDTLQSVTIAMTKTAREPASASGTDYVYEGQFYSLSMSAFDPNTSPTAIQDLGAWTEITAGGEKAFSLTTRTETAGSRHRTGKAIYYGRDEHIDRANPYLPLEMKFSISDLVSTGAVTADVVYTFKLDVWDANNAPTPTSGTPEKYVGSSALVARDLSFTVQDKDLGDGLIIKQKAWSANTYITCKEFSPSGATDADKWEDIKLNALKDDDVIFKIENGSITAAESSCGASSLVAGSGATPTYTVNLDYWDSSRLSESPSLAFNFEVLDIVWWEISTADDYLDGAVTKQYSDKHPKPSLIEASLPQAVTVVATLDAPPMLQNTIGSITRTSAQGQPEKVISLYQGQTLIEPMSFYNPKKLAITCALDNENISPSNQSLPYMKYLSFIPGQGTQLVEATDIPVVVHIDPVTTSGNNMKILGTDPSNVRVAALEGALPHITGCVLYWKPGSHWFANPLQPGEIRTNNIRVKVVIGTTTFYMNYLVGTTASSQQFISNGAPDTSPRTDTTSFSWTASSELNPGDIVPTDITQSPNLIIEEGDSVTFRALLNGSPFVFGSPTTEDVATTWYIDGEAVSSDRASLILRTDYLSSGMHSVSLSVRAGTSQPALDGKPGIQTFSTNVYVRNTRAFPRPITDRTVNGLGFARLDVSTNTSTFNPFHLRSLWTEEVDSSRTFRGLAVQSSSATATDLGLIQPAIVSFRDAPAKTLSAPFSAKDSVGAISSQFSGLAQSRAVSSKISFSGSPSFMLNEEQCNQASRGSSYWSTSCSNNTIWLTGLNTSTATWWQPASIGSNNTNESTLSTSYDYLSPDLLSFKWGASDWARLDLRHDSALLLGALSQESSFAAGGTSKWRSLTGGISSTGQEDGSWVLAVTEPLAGDPVLYLIKNVAGTPTPVAVSLPVGFVPAWSWVAQCAECTSPATERSLVVMSSSGVLRWGRVNISTGGFTENPTSTTVCASGTGCPKFAFAGSTTPRVSESVWHQGHLFPAKYTSAVAGNNLFMMIERNSSNVWSLSPDTGRVERLGIAGASLSTLSCNNPQTVPSPVAGLPINERCYVGDAGNESVQELR